MGVLAFLGLGLVAYGQTDDRYGKMGINTSSPKATLEVQPSAVNLGDTATTNEGIIAPKLSKTRIAAIANPIEGTLVYATDEDASKISAYAGDNAKVAKITEKGYYYYNGTEWVKSTGSGAMIWVNDSTNKVAKIKNLSDGITERKDENSIFINDEGKVSIGALEDFSGTPKLRVHNFDNDTSTRFSIGAYQMAFSRLQNSVNGAMLLLQKGRGNNYESKEFIQSGDNLGRIRFSPEYVAADLTGKEPVEIDGAYINVRAREVVDEEHFSTTMEFATRSKNASQSYIAMRLNDTGFLGIGTPDPTERLEVNGNIKTTSLVGQGNRPVYADADGKLIIGDATNALASLKWVEDTTNNAIKLAVNSAGAERTQYPVSISDEGVVSGSSFRGASGATIFPDYVFQKYYTGTSSLKADYNFKTLSQVENFVKVNGHLPGYKSAAEIKKQGYIDLMATQLTNVEKIEELYLHSIEQDKALKAKDAEIKAMKEELSEIKALLKKLQK
ncbi:hypothetical protein [Bergeyella sp. RCAD1439]|uniref:hypothetical protein n=1 Tax=Bergeyella anatis TaxID=3113737 RepID=UPI002E18EC02|nr:hypothetical protein [Bergeyella sp. RCAD1439]